MDNVCRRYYLVVKDQDSKEKTYVLNYFSDDDFGKKNYVLSSIDNLTLNFDNEEEFLTFLRDYTGVNIDNSEAKIEYKANKRIRNLEIVYNDKSLLKPFASTSKTLIQDYDLFMEFFTHFMKSIHKQDFLRYMSNKNHINNRLQLLIEEYIYQNNRYRRKDIKEHIQNYRVIRDYFLGALEYNEKHRDKINLEAFNQSNNDYVNTPIINLNTEDEFLNSLSSREEILKHYTLDQLEELGVLGIFDGLDKPKKLILK